MCDGYTGPLKMEKTKGTDCTISIELMLSRGDWRELLAATKVITFFRLIKLNPVNLLMQLFDIYALGGIRGSSSTVGNMMTFYSPDF